MKYRVLCVFVALSLGGCQTALERKEMADDSYCRRVIAERGDKRPSAYEECRSNMMAYRDQQTADRQRHMTVGVYRY